MRGFNIIWEHFIPRIFIRVCSYQSDSVTAWSPFFSGFRRYIIDNPKFPEVNEKLDELALKYDVSKEAISVAWILRHPVNFQVVVGTTRSDDLRK